MNAAVETIDGVTVLRLAVEALDAANADGLKALLPGADETAAVVLAMASVTFIDSSGWGAIVSVLRRVQRSGGRLVVVGLQPELRQTFELIRLDRIIPPFETLEAALRHLRRP